MSNNITISPEGAGSHNFSFDPGSDAKKLAAGTISAATRSLFGGIVGPVLSDDILGIFGLGSSGSTPDYTAYFNQINSQLSSIQGDIQALQQSINAVQSSVKEILANVQALSHQLSQSTIDIEFQSVLHDFQQQCTIISENYTTYVNAITAIAGKDEKLIKEGVSDLFALFQLTNLQQIAIAMTNIQNFFNPILASTHTIQSFHQARLDDAIANYKPSDKELQPSGFPEWGNIYFATTLFPSVFTVADTELKMIAATFRLGVAAQVQALSIIGTAWLGSDQESQVGNAAKAMNATSATMAKFVTDLLEGIGTTGDMNTRLQYLVYKYTTRPNPGNEACGSYNSVDLPNGDPIYPYDGDSLPWDAAYPTDYRSPSKVGIRMAQLPWTGKAWKIAANIPRPNLHDPRPWPAGTTTYLGHAIDFWDVTIYINLGEATIGPVNIPVYSLPQELSFVTTLVPAS